jgi:two-component system chemotaxis family response regulator WspR
MIDVDYFKHYNDTYGHLAGDDVLKRVAQAIGGSSKRPGDLATRYGGEEFTVILPATPLSGAFRVAEKLRKQVEELNIAHGRSPYSRVTVSIGGAAAIPSRGVSALQLIQAADRALYTAKESGRNRCAMLNDRDANGGGPVESGETLSEHAVG